jgi:hypothetical protein
MSRWFRVAVPLGIAAVLVSVLAIGFGSPSSLAAPGGNGHGKANGQGNGGAPTLALAPNPHADVGQWVTVTGEGFPKDTAVFVVITGSASLLEKTDRAGSFETGTAFAEVGSYTFSACYLQKNGRWDCSSTPPVTLEVVE